MDDRILLGLHVSRLSLAPGEHRSAEALAAYAGCSKRYIQKLEKSALEKMRKRLLQFRHDVTA